MAEKVFRPLDERDTAHYAQAFLILVRDCAVAMKYQAQGEHEAVMERLGNMAEFAAGEGEMLLARLTRRM